MNAAIEKRKNFVFTGWHMLATMVAFFGVIISVNMLMAYYASSSWSGILAKNTYVASQEFNVKAEEARAWAARGFKGAFVVKDAMLEYRLSGPQDEIASLKSIDAVFHRPVGDKQDFTLKLTRSTDGVFIAQHALASGQWIVDLAAIEDGKIVYHQAERFVIGEK
jgi:nitrogen fixation protein FixH